MPAPPSSIEILVGRFDPAVFDSQRRRTRIRLDVADEGARDVLVEDGRATLVVPSGRPDALIKADEQTWRELAAAPAGGFDAYRLGRLSVRRNLHIGVGFLAATSGATEPTRLRFRTVRSASGKLSI